ncbi:MAG: hypothetical protein RLP13_07655, partial [Cytophagales bacterium]
LRSVSRELRMPLAVLGVYAGAAARPILDLIYEYEQAVELEQQAEQEIILDKIHRLMAGEPVEIDLLIDVAVN